MFGRVGPLRLALIYAVFGTVWIVVSDQMASAFFPATSEMVFIQTLKGLVFITVSSLFVYVLMHYAMRHLQRSESRYRELFENHPDALFVLGDGGSILDANRAALKVYGHDLPTFKKMALGDLMVPEMRDEAISRMRDALAKRATYETRHRRQDGTLFDAEISALPITLDGRACLIACVRDVSARKQAEASLQESERRLMTLMSNLPGMAYRCYNAPVWTMVFVSDGCRELIGCPADELVENRRYRYADFIHSEDRQKVWDEVQRCVREKRPFELTYRLQTVEGAEKWVCEKGRGVHDERGRLVALEGLVSDITPLKQAEAELRASEQRYRALFEHSHEGAALIRRERFAECNARMCEMLDMSADELIGRTPWDVSPEIQPDGRNSQDKATTSLARVLRGEPQIFEWQHRRRDGTLIDTEISLVRVDVNERPHVLVLARDVTERIQAQRQRESLEAQLRQAQKMEAIGQLAGGVAHDFNNILTAILGNVELCINWLKSSTKPREALIESLSHVEEGALRAAGLTRQLLAFSRHQVTQPQILDLNEILSSLDNMLQRLIPENITLEAHTEPQLHRVCADRGQIEQVLINLVVNAADAMKTGGRLTIETANVTLDENYVATHAEAQHGPHVLLAVSDTGHGMAAETKEHLFEPFFTTKSPGKGTGLGLSTVYGIVKQAGGDIQVYSEPGKGSTFKVFLPVAEGEVSPPPAPFEESISGGSETILLCEDDRAVRHMTERMLSSAGYTVLAAEDGREALGIAEKHASQIQLVITDVIIPDMNGRELADALRALRPGLPILFISGYSANVIAHHGVIAADVHFLEKPFTYDDLLRHVRRALEPVPQ